MKKSAILTGALIATSLAMVSAFLFRNVSNFPRGFYQPLLWVTDVLHFAFPNSLVYCVRRIADNFLVGYLVIFCD